MTRHFRDESGGIHGIDEGQESLIRPEWVEVSEAEVPNFVYAGEPPTVDDARKLSLMAGIEFDGVMCSAHKEDQWGLDSVKGYVAAGRDIDFQFKNGNVLTLTAANIGAFEAVWFPFRVAHTKVNFQP